MTRFGASGKVEQNKTKETHVRFSFHFRRPTPRSLLPAALAGVLGASVLFTAGVAAESATSREKARGAKPTIVLVHGAFADASSWNGVVERLLDEGYPVLAPANPLRGVASDAAYVSSFLDTVSGPVVLVGHSYGGAVITNAAVNQANVKALVYVAAFIPDVGQAVGSLSPKPGSQIVPPGIPGVPATLILRPWALPDGTKGADGYIDPDKFRQIFAADLPADQAAVMAATQRGASLQTLGEPTQAAAWKTIPSWAVVATRDNAIGTANVHDMAEHAGAHIVNVEGSHVVMISHPDAVVRVIRTAARSVD
jgi:pimeloyl-ACP methyl ester carboxylesterase